MTGFYFNMSKSHRERDLPRNSPYSSKINELFNTEDAVLPSVTLHSHIHIFWHAHTWFVSWRKYLGYWFDLTLHPYLLTVHDYISERMGIRNGSPDDEALFEKPTDSRMRAGSLVLKEHSVPMCPRKQHKDGISTCITATHVAFQRMRAPWVTGQLQNQTLCLMPGSSAH